MAARVLDEIGELMGTNTGEPRRKTWLHQQIGLAIIRGNAQSTLAAGWRFTKKMRVEHKIYIIRHMAQIHTMRFLLFSTWAWNIICAPDIFSWNFCFMLINMGQTLYILYTMRKVKFMPELEDAYSTLFKPVQVSRLLFKKLVGIEYGQVVSLHAGEAYAMQDVTRTDRLGLLISGKYSKCSHRPPVSSPHSSTAIHGLSRI
ncbi:Popeye domain-containing protein 3 [Nymphon striatum]|nr:Popeye domain-containing protein 3 [Nymphon striatum]